MIDTTPKAASTTLKVSKAKFSPGNDIFNGFCGSFTRLMSFRGSHEQQWILCKVYQGLSWGVYGLYRLRGVIMRCVMLRRFRGVRMGYAL